MTPGRITEQLTRIAGQDDSVRQDGLEKLLDFTYEALHRIAENKLNRERSQTRATRLIHDMVPGLLRRREPFQNRQHFFSWAKMQMERVYLDWKRGERRESRGGTFAHVGLTPELPAPNPLDAATRIDLKRAIARLAQQDRDFLSYLCEGHSVKAAAEMASIPPENAPRRRQLILAKLANLLGHGAQS